VSVRPSVRLRVLCTMWLHHQQDLVELTSAGDISCHSTIPCLLTYVYHNRAENYFVLSQNSGVICRLSVLFYHIQPGQHVRNSVHAEGGRDGAAWCDCVQHVMRTSSNVTTPVAVFLPAGSATATMTVEICLMNRTAVSSASITCCLQCRSCQKFSERYSKNPTGPRLLFVPGSSGQQFFFQQLLVGDHCKIFIEIWNLGLRLDLG